MTEETASLVSVNTVHAETQQPQDLINKQGLCKEGDNCYCCIEGNEKTDRFPCTCLNDCTMQQIVVFMWHRGTSWLNARCDRFGLCIVKLKKCNLEFIQETAASFKGQYSVSATLSILSSALHWKIFDILRTDNRILLIECTQTCKFYLMTNSGWPQAFLIVHQRCSLLWTFISVVLSAGNRDSNATACKRLQQGAGPHNIAE